jgi:radical SAM-linked protein
MRAIARSIRRADIPVAYSGGFNPRPKISMGPPLPLGYESMCELADVVLTSAISPEVLRERLGRAMPRGLDLIETTEVIAPWNRLSRASAACYMVELVGQDIIETAESLLQQFLSKASVPIERVRQDKKNTVDAKHFLREAELVVQADSRWLRVEIAIGGQGACSASEMAGAILDLPPERAKCLRIIRSDILFDGR